MTERRLVYAAEVALALVTTAAVFGMQRLFDTSSFVGTLLLHSALAHLTVTAVRRRGLGLLPAGALTAVAALLATTWISYGDTTTAGIPTGRTLTALSDDLDAAWQLFQRVVAPAPVETGFVVATALAIWFVAFVADWAAFRLWVPFEATLPAGTLFLFASLLGSDRFRSISTLLFAASVVAFMLIHRIVRQGGIAHWVTEHRAKGHRALLAVGTVLGGIAVVAASAVGPSLPGADSAPLIEWRDITDGPSSRVTVSPLVDIKTRLVDQAPVEVFTVQTNQRAYWRLTALDRFDGRIWSSSGSYGKADGELPRGDEIAPTVESMEQVFTISQLAAIWLPAAFEARAIEVVGADVRYDERSSTLIVDTEYENSDGISYRVLSESPRLTPDQLRTATREQVPADILDRYLALPPGFSPRTAELASALTNGTTTPYDAALALQNHLRGFTYDLTVDPGHGGDALERFLFDTQRGYCEQFAGAFAGLARAAGLPARVAVGFTPGVQDELDPTLYRVRGEHAHAWPELYLAGFGWVAFEPTPGRGAPFAEQYTGVDEAQDTPGGSTEPTVVTTLVPDTSTGGSTPSTNPIDRGQLDQPLDVGGNGTDNDSVTDRWYVRWAITVASVILGLALAYLIVVPSVGALQRARRRRTAVDPAGRVHVAWTESQEALELLGVQPSAAETYGEYATRVATAIPETRGAVGTLARVAEVTDYSPTGADEDGAGRAESAAGAISTTVKEQTTLKQRVLRTLDIRRVLPHSARSRRRAGWSPRRPF